MWLQILISVTAGVVTVTAGDTYQSGAPKCVCKPVVNVEPAQVNCPNTSNQWLLDAAMTQISKHQSQLTSHEDKIRKLQEIIQKQEEKLKHLASLVTMATHKQKDKDGRKDKKEKKEERKRKKENDNKKRDLDREKESERRKEKQVKDKKREKRDKERQKENRKDEKQQKDKKKEKRDEREKENKKDKKQAKNIKEEKRNVERKKENKKDKKKESEKSERFDKKQKEAKKTCEKSKKTGQCDTTVTSDQKNKYKDSKKQTQHKAVVYGKDCADIQRHELKQFAIAGIYKIKPLDSEKHFKVLCDFETDGGGWTVIQRRVNDREDFYKDWNAYRRGFGDLTTNFWLGNKKLHMITTQRMYELRVDMTDFKGRTAYAMYNSFSVDNEKNKYRLNIGKYKGTAGDSLAHHNNRAFSTYDRDNDESKSGNCAKENQGGWWYGRCYSANLNGRYSKKHRLDGIVWHEWHNNHAPLQSVQMKIRPIGFKSLTTKDGK